ncbi:hypothetical protein [Streptomyces acidiscabies]|uniref:Uncharacterized protein n=1 Tax=Streptomyces acidiscabies TaxID=42234 RepID=A0A0L0KN21_9ACTN|nr:hypothetical protein [Streptomyces acidiscabies]KND39010.1 hypothetical protein IQ63_05595 [Streptomyces acidiscabies]
MRDKGTIGDGDDKEVVNLAMELLLADRLKFIGEVLEKDSPQGVEVAEDGGAVAAPSRRRWAVPLLLFGLAASIAVAVGVRVPWASSEEDGAAKLDQGGIVACSRLVVEGTVAGVEDVGGGSVRVRLDVDRYLKPASGSAESAFLVSEEDGAAYRTGERVLVSVSRFADEAPLLFTGAEVDPTLEWMEAEINRPDGPSCPGRG